MVPVQPGQRIDDGIESLLLAIMDSDEMNTSYGIG